MNDPHEEIDPAIAFDASSAESATLERSVAQASRRARYSLYTALAGIVLAILCAAWPSPHESQFVNDKNQIIIVPGGPGLSIAAPFFLWAAMTAFAFWAILSILAELKAIRWDLARKK